MTPTRKRRVRIPDGCDQQGRLIPGTWLEFDDDSLPGDGSLAHFGLAAILASFGLTVWAITFIYDWIKQ